MTIRLRADIAHAAPWLRAHWPLAPTGGLAGPYWPTWAIGGAPFDNARLRAPRRHGGVIPWDADGVSLAPLDAYSDLRLPGWLPPPAPSAADAGWIVEPVWTQAVGSMLTWNTPAIDVTVTDEDEDGYDDTAFAAPAARTAPALADPQNPLMHLTCPRPPAVPAYGRPTVSSNYSDWSIYTVRFDEEDYGGGYAPWGAWSYGSTALPLVKSGTEGLTTRLQSAQCAYLVQVLATNPNYFESYTDRSWLWNPTTQQWSFDTSEEFISAHRTRWGHLYACFVDPETGLLTDAVPVPECRRIFGPVGFDQYDKPIAMTWCAGVRRLQCLPLYEIATTNAMRLAWRPVRPWHLRGPYSLMDNANGPWVPSESRYAFPGWYSHVEWWRGWNEHDESDMQEVLRNGGTSGAWRELAVTGSSSTRQWLQATLVDPPAAGEEILVAAAQTWYDDELDQWGAYAIVVDLWPEAAALPFALSRWLGGAMVGGSA